jgi:hypothetical protein
MALRTNGTLSLTAKAQEEAFEEVPRQVQTHPGFGRGADTLEMPTPRDRHGRYGSLPVMNEVKREARRRKIDLLILPTEEALEALAKKPDDTNAIPHVTC